MTAVGALGRVAVIGAGAAGLAAGVALLDAGASVTVLEAADAPGGKLSTIREGGWLYERAAIGLLDREGDLAPLAERLGLQLWPARKEASRRWVMRGDRLYALPSGPLSFLGTGLLSAAEKWRLVREPWVAKREGGEDESVRAFFARRLGPGGAFLADALQTGIYAGDADRLDAAACFPSLVQAEAKAGSIVRGMRRAKSDGRPRQPRLTTFAGGLAELVAGLSRLLGPALRLSTEVLGIRRDGPRWELTTRDRSGRGALQADAVIVAAPAPQAALLLEPLDPALAGELRALKAAPIASVHLGVRREDVLGDTRGFGLLSPGRPVLGTLLPSSLWPGRAPEGGILLSSLVGGARFPEHAALPDADLEALVRAELGQTLRLRAGAKAELLRVVRWPEAVPQYQPGHRARIASIEAGAARHPALALTSAWYRGVSVLDCLRDGKRQALQLLAAVGGAG